MYIKMLSANFWSNNLAYLNLPSPVYISISLHCVSLWCTILHISFHLNNKRCAGNVLVCCCTTSTVRPCCQSPVSFLVEYSHRDTLFLHVTVHVLHRLVASCTHGAHVAAVHVGCWYAYTPASSALLENICRFSLFSLGHEPT